MKQAHASHEPIRHHRPPHRLELYRLSLHRFCTLAFPFLLYSRLTAFFHIYRTMPFVYPVDEPVFLEGVSREIRRKVFDKPAISVMNEILATLDGELREGETLGSRSPLDRAASKHYVAMLKGLKLPDLRDLQKNFCLDSTAVAGLSFIVEQNGEQVRHPVLPLELYYSTAMNFISVANAADDLVSAKSLRERGLQDPNGKPYYMNTDVLKYLFPDDAPKRATLFLPLKFSEVARVPPATSTSIDSNTVTASTRNENEQSVGNRSGAILPSEAEIAAVSRLMGSLPGGNGEGHVINLNNFILNPDNRTINTNSNNTVNSNNAGGATASSALTEERAKELFEENFAKQNETLQENQQQVAEEAARKTAKASQDKRKKQQEENASAANINPTSLFHDCVPSSPENTKDHLKFAIGTTLEIDETHLERLYFKALEQQPHTYEMMLLVEAVENGYTLPASVLASVGSLAEDVSQYVERIINPIAEEINVDGEKGIHCGQAVLAFPENTCFLSCSVNEDNNGYALDDERDGTGAPAFRNKSFYEITLTRDDGREFAMILAAKDEVRAFEPLDLVLDVVAAGTNLKHFKLARSAFATSENLLLTDQTHSRLLSKSFDSMTFHKMRKGAKHQCREAKSCTRLVYDECEFDDEGKHLFGAGLYYNNIVQPRLDVHFKNCQVPLEPILFASKIGLLKCITFEGCKFTTKDIEALQVLHNQSVLTLKSSIDLSLECQGMYKVGNLRKLLDGDKVMRGLYKQTRPKAFIVKIGGEKIEVGMIDEEYFARQVVHRQLLEADDDIQESHFRENLEYTLSDENLGAYPKAIVDTPASKRYIALKAGIEGTGTGMKVLVYPEGTQIVCKVGDDSSALVVEDDIIASLPGAFGKTMGLDYCARKVVSDVGEGLELEDVQFTGAADNSGALAEVTTDICKAIVSSDMQIDTLIIGSASRFGDKRPMPVLVEGSDFIKMANKCRRVVFENSIIGDELQNSFSICGCLLEFKEFKFDREGRHLFEERSTKKRAFERPLKIALACKMNSLTLVENALKEGRIQYLLIDLEQVGESISSLEELLTFKRLYDNYNAPGRCEIRVIATAEIGGKKLSTEQVESLVIGETKVDTYFHLIYPQEFSKTIDGVQHVWIYGHKIPNVRLASGEKKACWRCKKMHLSRLQADGSGVVAFCASANHEDLDGIPGFPPEEKMFGSART
jgi:hypothetical protein